MNPKEPFSLQNINPNLYEEDRGENMKTLELWRQYYDDLADFRKRYLRNFDYSVGNQLGKIIRDSKGNQKTQRKIVEEQGKTPVIINVIREMVRTVLGQYRMNPSRSVVFARKENDKVAGEMLTLALHASLERNSFRELDAQMMEILILSGFSCSRITSKFFDTELQQDAYIKNMNPCMMFFNGDIHDVRGDDIHIIGEIIETTIDNVVATFAKNYQELVALRKVLKPMATEYIGGQKSLSPNKYQQKDFYTPSDPSNIRIYFGWTKKNEFRVFKHDPLDGTRNVVKGDITQILSEIEQQNNQRADWLQNNGFSQEEIMMSLIDTNVINYTYWEYKVLTINGYCIAKGESPFEHNSHPYSILLRPLINGHVSGLVDDIIDIQDVINQTFMTFKWMVEASAKGLLLVPEDSIPDGMDINDFAEQWSKVGGVIKIRLKPGAQLPTEINAVSNQNVRELLNFALAMMDKVSGIHGALRGEEPKAGTPSSLYAQQANNSAVSILNMLKSFEHYIRDRDKKTLKTIIQLYEDQRYIDLYGESISDEAKRWNKEKVKDVEFDLLVSSTADNPFYKLLLDDKLLKLLDMNMITAKAYLRNSNEPFAQKLLNDLEKEEQEAANTQQQPMQQPQPQPQMPQTQMPETNL
jgi:uncharacterized protein YnzC (UPF0291/DUF896 family)